MKKITSHGQRITQNPLQIPSQRPIYRLLQAFKLQQYAKNFVDQGFGDEVYKLTMITHRKRQELIDSIELLPGHKQRFIELFRRIDNMYPRQNVQRTVDNAIRICSSRQSVNSRMSVGAMGGTTQESTSLNVSTDAIKNGQPQIHESIQQTTAMSITQNATSGTPSLIQTQPINMAGGTAAERHNLSVGQQQPQTSGIQPPTQFVKKDRFGRSPPSQGKPSRRSTGTAAPQQQSSLVRKFAGLDAGTRTAINDSFLQNIRSGKSQVTTVADALKEFYGKDTKTKQSVINKIFGNPVATMGAANNQRNGIKPHHSLAQANAVEANRGFGLGKFVKVQKGANVIDKYKSQISQQSSFANMADKKPASSALVKRQNSRTEGQPPRRALDKKARNSNSSSDSKPTQAQVPNHRKGSHPAQPRKKNPSNSSERKETFGLLANQGSATKNKTTASGLQPILGNARTQVMSQQRQQRVTSHSRIQMKQNSNFMIAPNSSRGDFQKLAGKPQQSTKNSGGGSTLLKQQQQPPQGRTRLHRVRSAAGYKDVQAEKDKDKASSSHATSTINSTAVQDYTSSSAKKTSGTGSGSGVVVNAGQQAAMKRLQLHRQRSAKKQLSSTQSEVSQQVERQSVTAASKKRADNRPPPTAPSASSQSTIPPFIQQPKVQQASKQHPTTTARKQVSRDRGANFNIDATSSAASHANFSGKAAAAKGGADQANSSYMRQQTQTSAAATHYGIGSTTSQHTMNNEAHQATGPKLKRSSSLGGGVGKAAESSAAAGVKQTDSKLLDYQNTNHGNAGTGVQAINSKNGMSANNTSGVSQSAAFADFRLPTDSITPSESEKKNQSKKDEMLPAISSTVKKANQKALLDDINDSGCGPAAMSSPQKLGSSIGKPPMSHHSSARRSTYTAGSKAADVAMSESQSPHKSPLKSSLTGASPRRPLVLEPIQNPPSVDVTKPEAKLDEAVFAGGQNVAPPEDEANQVNHEENNIKWTPLLDKNEKFNARDYGYSFGSKKVAMGPGFINLRFMCHCLARAIKRHLEFSKGDLWFLQDLQSEQDDVDLEFSYQLPPDLKLTLNPKGVRVTNEDDDEDANPFQREDDTDMMAGVTSPVRDIETMDIEVDARTSQPKRAQTEKNSAARRPVGASGNFPGGEPEPEIIKSSDGEDSIKKVSNFAKDQFSNQKNQQQKASGEDDDDMIGEELDEDDEDGYSQKDFEQEEEDLEEQSIKEVRREQLRKSVFEKDEKRINEYLNQRKVNELEEKLRSKDKQIAQLTRLVSSTGVTSEIMAISDAVDEEQQEGDEEGFYDRAGIKMDRADQIMAQVDLDPIESHGSMEMSTTKFKSLQGKRFLNSEGGHNAKDNGNSALESNRTNNTANVNVKTGKEGQQAQPAMLEKKKEKKSAKSYESAYVDVSEDKMREFAMSQLRHFDLRMEYDNLIFNEDQFIPMPSEKYIADYCKYVTIACKMENEIPIVCLVYLEKLLLTTGILLNKWNWRRIVLICLCLASKIWDDDSLENVHFPKVMSDVTNFEINKLEQLFLEFIDYKLVIKGAEYAKYYFILRSMAEDIHKENSQIVPLKGNISPFENARRNQANKEEWAEFPLRAPISAEKMLELQRQEAKAEVYLKERHEREFLNAYIGNKGGSRKDQTRHPSLLLDRTM